MKKITNKVGALIKKQNVNIKIYAILIILVLLTGSIFTYQYFKSEKKENTNSQPTIEQDNNSPEIAGETDKNKGNETSISTQTNPPPKTTQKSVTSKNQLSTEPAPENPPTNPIPTPHPEPTYTDTYPAEWQSQCGGIDPWGMTKCQSVSYTAWKVNEKYSNMPTFPMDYRNANKWPAGAELLHIPTGSVPKVHPVGITTNSGTPYGLSVWIEAIDGDNVTASSYNWGIENKFRVATVSATYFQTYIYFGDK